MARAATGAWLSQLLLHVTPSVSKPSQMRNVVTAELTAGLTCDCVGGRESRGGNRAHRLLLEGADSCV